MLFKALLFLGLCLLLTQAIDCDADNDCRPLNTCEDQECVHKDLVTIRGCEWAASLILILVAAGSKAVGIGSKA